MLLAVFILIMGICTLYMYKKFKELEQEYYNLHIENLKILNENQILINKVNDLEYYKKDMSKIINTLQNNQTSQRLFLDEQTLNNLIDEIPEIDKKIYNEKYIESFENKSDEADDNKLQINKTNSMIDKHESNEFAEIQDLNTLNYEKYKI
jgi:transcriptional regulator of met regulon